MRHTTLIPCLFALGLPLLAVAAAPPYDCGVAGPHRDFDFWLGQWEVHDAKGQPAGTNRITRIQNGCALDEHWQSTRGGTGQSLNYYHPGKQEWHQLWVDGGASIIDIRGGLQQGAMIMDGSIYYLKQKRTKGFRARWTPLPDGRVRQFFEEQKEDGSWGVWFDGYYTRTSDE